MFVWLTTAGLAAVIAVIALGACGSTYGLLVTYVKPSEATEVENLSIRIALEPAFLHLKPSLTAEAPTPNLGPNHSPATQTVPVRPICVILVVFM